MDMNYVRVKSANYRPECPGVSQHFKLADQPIPTGYSQHWENLSTRNRNFFMGKYKYLIALFQKVPNPFSGVYASGLRDKAYFHVSGSLSSPMYLRLRVIFSVRINNYRISPPRRSRYATPSSEK
jgi:hypothetical protein